jgi:hypothetical protein
MLSKNLRGFEEPLFHGEVTFVSFSAASETRALPKRSVSPAC